MNFSIRCLVSATAVFFLSGCWNVSRDKISLQFGLKKGAGSFLRTLGGLYCEEKGQSCSGKEYPISENEGTVKKSSRSWGWGP